MNNDYFLHTAMRGEYPKAFVGEPPYKEMGFMAGDEKIMKAPLDWIGFHYYTRRIVSNAGAHAGGQASFGTEIEMMPEPAAIATTQFPCRDADGRSLTDAGLEIWPHGIYDLVMQITREYNHISVLYEIYQKAGCSIRRTLR